MKILHISTSDRRGGAAIASYRLMQSIASRGIESKMFVLRKLSDDNNVIEFSKHNIFSKIISCNRLFLIDAMRNVFLRPKNSFSLGLSGVSGVYKYCKSYNPDIIIIHWVREGFVSLNEIKRISSLGLPIFLFLHDEWFYTGGCHSTLNCSQFTNGCHNCPQLSKLKFISSINLKKKSKAFASPNIKIFAPSKWIKSQVEISKVLADKECFILPNTFNSSTFNVMDKLVARSILGLPLDRKLILYGAVAGSENPTKGWPDVNKLLESYEGSVDLVVFGSRPSKDSYGNYNIHALGKITDEYSMCLIYNAVDVFLSPSIAESFGQTIVESIACGTKVVVYPIGGILDIVTHKFNGYFAEIHNIDSLRAGVEWAFSTDNSIENRNNLHQSMSDKFSYDIISSQILKIFQKSSIQ